MIGKKVVTSKPEIDPISGSMTWKVTNVPDFTGIVKSYNRLILDFVKAMKENDLSDDPVMHDVLIKMKSNREFLHKTLKRKYPDYIEKLSKR